MTDTQNHLFDVPAAERPAAKPGDLWVPRALRSSRASPEENERVRAMLKDYITEQVVAHEGVYPSDLPDLHAAAVARQRGIFARYSLELGERLQLRTWGTPRKLHHAKGAKARKDAAYTNLRQFWMGKDLADWALCLIEATICDLRGMALPGCAYATQRTLDQDAVVRARRGEAKQKRPRPQQQRPTGMW
jgi:hypothetical protein